jgi:hypothetical protein
MTMRFARRAPNNIELRIVIEYFTDAPRNAESAAYLTGLLQSIAAAIALHGEDSRAGRQDVTINIYGPSDETGWYASLARDILKAVAEADDKDADERSGQ